jgi:hypothetical protein
VQATRQVLKREDEPHDQHGWPHAKIILKTAQWIGTKGNLFP